VDSDSELDEVVGKLEGWRAAPRMGAGIQGQAEGAGLRDRASAKLSDGAQVSAILSGSTTELLHRHDHGRASTADLCGAGGEVVVDQH
jgi:hypothetical protein